MGRKNLIAVALFCFATLQLSAQSGSGSFEFVENKGQWEKEVKFKGEFSSGAFFLTARGFSVNLHHPDDLERYYKNYHAGHGDHGISRPPRNTKVSTNATQNPNDPGNGGGGTNPPGDPIVVRGHTYKVIFAGSNPNPEIVPEKQVSNNTSYFIGNDPSKWAKNVGTYTALTYKNVYEGIDVRYYADYGNLKYDIIVHPGADPSKVVMQYEGVEKLSVKSEELNIKTSVGTVRERYPYAYQFDMNSGKQDVECRFQVTSSNTVQFAVKNYSKTSTLVIDPTVIFVSFTGSFASEYGFTATPGPDGSLYSGSIVFGEGFRTTPGAYKQNYQGGSGDRGTDVGIFKFTPNGQRAWATYVGGSDAEYPHSLICDAAGNLVMIGRTYSGSSFPMSPSGSIHGGGGDADLFVTKLSADGSTLIGSQVIGGSGADCVNYQERQRSNGSSPIVASTMRFYGDDSRSEVVLDGAGNIYVAAQTQSLGSSRFYTTAGVFQTAPGGGHQDGVVLKLDPNCQNILWSSFLGGSGDDGAFVLAVHPTTGDVYVAGTTNSGDLPGGSTGSYQPSPAGGMDGFIVQISNNGANVLRKTYLGTNAFDAIYGIRFDRNFYPYVMGTTEGGNWPIINAAYGRAGSSQFIVKLRRDLSGVEYSTTFGNGAPQPNISPVAFLVDRCENVYISGWGGWIAPQQNPYGTGGVVGMPITPDASKSTTDNRDFYFFVMQKDAVAQLYGSYFGQMGGEGEHVDGGTSRYDELGVIYQAICANCFRSRLYPMNSPFPVTPNVWSQQNGSGDNGCNLAAVKIRFNFAGVISAPKSYFNGKPDTLGCAPFAVTFRDTIDNAQIYEWDYDGDGITDDIQNGPQGAYTYNNTGTYRVRLIAVDSSSCNIRDTAYLNIVVRDDKANIDFAWRKIGPCESTEFELINQSTLSGPASGKPFLPTSFTWDYADGSPTVTMGLGNPTHKFFGPGTYPVKLILANDDRYCNSPDTVIKNLRIATNVRAQFVTPPMGCQPYDAVFNNTSVGGHDFEWDFGDGSPISTVESPTHLYPNLGTYTIRLRAFDTSTCNKVHDTTFTITVNPKPVSQISPALQNTDINKPAVFNNNSTGGVRYKFIFGDGEERIKTTMDTTQHQYNATGTYNVMLVTFNQYECTDTSFAVVNAWVEPLLDVPNAFTPGRGGRNSLIKVEGFGISTMTWKIYNRNGQKVFETNSRFGAWDGTFNGKLQPMDVYVYTLEVQFTDGKRLTKTGDITLIR